MKERMKTEIKGKEGIREASEIIKNGGIVAFPTETVYGIGANAFDKEAIKKIFKAKGRPQDNPLIVHLSNKNDIKEVAYTNEISKKLFEIFSPGPITLILKKKECIPYEVTAGLDSVGIRIPKHKMALEFIEKSGFPIAAPSANISSRISPTNAKDVFEDMQGRLPLILDGGDCEIGIESTVIDVTKDIPVILRPGAVTIEMLLKYIPKIRNHHGKIEVASSPGMKYKHYAPIVDCVLAKSQESAIIEYEKESDEGKNVVILGKKDFIKDKNINFVCVGENPNEIAKNIYKKMREAEKIYDLIIIEKFSDKDIEYSIMNRLNKSTQGVIV